MTKSQESGENEVTEQAKREAARTGRDICDILEEMLARAKAARDTERSQKIIRAQKYYGCRNIAKRRGKR